MTDLPWADFPCEVCGAEPIHLVHRISGDLAFDGVPAHPWTPSARRGRASEQVEPSSLGYPGSIKDVGVIETVSLGIAGAVALFVGLSVLIVAAVLALVRVLP